MRLIISLLFITVSASASSILYSQNFESGAVPGQFYGGTLLNTSGVPTSVGDGNWVLYNNSGGTPIGTTGSAIGLSLTGLTPNQSASLEFTFLAIDSWDGLDMGTFSPDYFGVQINPNLVFSATFRNWMATHYTGDGSAEYGSAPPPNSTITKLSSDSDYLVSSANDSFYDIKIDNIHADASGNLTIYFLAYGGGWQGGADESFGIDNLLITSDQIPGESPEPGTWLTLSAGLGFFLFRRTRRA
jgi:hypothetical protein